MVIDDFDLLGVGSVPDEAEAPLVVDAEGMLAFAVALQRLETIAGRQAEEFEFHRGVDELKLHQCTSLQVGRQAPYALTGPERRSLGVGKTPDHGPTIACRGYPSNRLSGQRITGHQPLATSSAVTRGLSNTQVTPPATAVIPVHPDVCAGP